MISTDSVSPDDELTGGALDEAMLGVLRSAGVTSLSPSEVAQKLNPDGDWHRLLIPVRRAAVSLAAQGRAVIYRKGKPVDPNNFSGVYRIGLPRQD